MALALIHLRQGGVGQLRVLGGGQEGRKGWVGSPYPDWWVLEVDVLVAGSPLKAGHPEKRGDFLSKKR